VEHLVPTLYLYSPHTEQYIRRTVLCFKVNKIAHLTHPLPSPSPPPSTHFTLQNMAASVEEKKIKYSQELAAHTLRQWNAVRSSPKPAEKQKNRGQSKPRQDADRGQENRDRQSPENGDRQDNGQTTPGSRRDNTGRRGAFPQISIVYIEP
jgi:hypothetical protein